MVVLKLIIIVFNCLHFLRVSIQSKTTDDKGEMTFVKMQHCTVCSSKSRNYWNVYQ